MPVVYGELKGDEGATTVLVYGHYDVQPPDPLDLWETPPFEPTVKGDRVYCRGAQDDKGQIFAFLCGVRELAAGALPPRCRLEALRLATISPASAARREGLAAEVEAVRGELPAKLREYFDSLRIPARIAGGFSDDEIAAIAADAAETLIDRLAGEGGDDA